MTDHDHCPICGAVTHFGDGHGHGVSADAEDVIAGAEPGRPSGKSAEMNWIEVDESLPHNFTLVIVHTSGGDVEPAYFAAGRFISVDPNCDAGEEINVLHWMQLPAPPRKPEHD